MSGASVARADDGRVRKGQRRRDALQEATLRVIERGGVAGVTQRAVAREAGVPPSAVLYHFASVDTLLLATLRGVNDGYVAALGAVPQEREGALDALAAMAVDAAGRRRAQTRAEYELCLIAARRPDLRGELDRWYAALDGWAAHHVADPAARLALVAALDGLLLRGCCAEAPPSAAQVRRTLALLLPRS